MYRVHGDKIIRRRTNYRKAMIFRDIQRYLEKTLEICADIAEKILI